MSRTTADEILAKLEAENERRLTLRDDSTSESLQGIASRSHHDGYAYGIRYAANLVKELIPQTVSTPTEFDALPDGSVITWGGRVCQKTPEDKGAGWYMPGWAYAMPVESLLMDSDGQPWTVIGADHG